MKKLKESTELTVDDINQIISFYMQNFVNDRIQTSDRDSSQKNNVRLWYKAVLIFLASQSVVIKPGSITNEKM